jgi:hypothetical protein
MATDIIATHGSTKHVTLLHSRTQLLNRFDPFLHDHAFRKMQEMGIEVILGSRVQPEYINKVEQGTVKTMDGRELEADLIVSRWKLSSALYRGSDALDFDNETSISSGVPGNAPIRPIFNKPTHPPSTPTTP